MNEGGLFLFALYALHPLTNAYFYYLNTIKNKKYLVDIKKFTNRNRLNIIISFFTAHFVAFLLGVVTLNQGYLSVATFFLFLGLVYKLVFIPTDYITFGIYGNRESVYKSLANTKKLIITYLLIQGLVIFMFMALPEYTETSNPNIIRIQLDE